MPWCYGYVLDPKVEPPKDKIDNNGLAGEEDIFIDTTNLMRGVKRKHTDDEEEEKPNDEVGLFVE